MQFTIAGSEYSVSIAPRPLVLNGHLCKALFDPARLRILIPDQLPAQERRRALFHELRHAWIFTFGKVTDSEEDADQSAEMMDVLMEQYLAQGGDVALLAMNPETERSAFARPVGPLAATVYQCGRCEAPIMAGSVVNETPEWNVNLGGYSMVRAAVCCVCDAATVWTESCTKAGLPLGAMLAHPAPEVITGAGAQKFSRRESVIRGKRSEAVQP